MPSGIRITRSRSARSELHQRPDLIQIPGLRDHELQLILVARHQLRRVPPVGCAGARAAWRSARPSGVEFASFGLMLIRSQATGANTVPAVSIVMCRSARAQALRKRDDLRRDHRLAAGHHHVARRMGAHLVQNLVERRTPSLRAATTCTAYRTRSSADCSRWCARRPRARRPARPRPESNRTAQRSSMPASSKPLRRSRQASHCPHGRRIRPGIVATVRQPEIQAKLAAQFHDSRLR